MQLLALQSAIARISNLDILRAASWGTLGSALLLLGGGVGGALGAVGASSHLWSDDAFLAGFALSCLIGAVGVYVLVAAFFGGIGPIRLPLPPLVFEKGGKDKKGQAVSRHAAPRAAGGEPGEPPPGGGRGGAGGDGEVAGGAGGAGGPGSGGGGGQGGGAVLPVVHADGTIELTRFEGGRGGRVGGSAGGGGGGT